MYVAMAPNNINVAYLGGSCDAGTPLVLKTTNAGASWTHVFNTAGNQNIATGWSGAGGDRGWGYGECLFGIGVCPTNANKVVVSDMGFVHVSGDGGASWRQAYVSAADQHPAGATTPVANTTTASASKTRAAGRCSGPTARICSPRYRHSRRAQH